MKMVLNLISSSISETTAFFKISQLFINDSAVSFFTFNQQKTKYSEDREGLLNVSKHFLIQGQSTADN